MKLCPICATSYPDGNRTCPTHGTLLVDVDELPAGTMIRDCYRIERVIGKGGMGTVYLAQHMLLGEQRALKFLSNALASNPQFLQRFLQEARAASKLRHPNIAATLELGQAEGGSLYICMEFVDGPSLRAVMKASPQGLPPERAFAIARGVAEGLGVAHSKGMVHRDVKPENILMGSSVDHAGNRFEIPKVVDFGIVAMSDSASHLTQTGQQLLTAEYAAPEQWRGMAASALDGRTDFYSLGCVLFEMLTGRQPFQSQTFEGWYQHHLYDTPPTPTSVKPELAHIRGVDALLAQFLAKDREYRPRDASAFIAMIDAVTAAMTGTQQYQQEAPRAQDPPATAAIPRNIASMGSGSAAPSGPSASEWAPVSGSQQTPQATPSQTPSSQSGYTTPTPQGNYPQPTYSPQQQPSFTQGPLPQTGLPQHAPPPARKQSSIRMGVLLAVLGGFLVITIGVVGSFLYLRKKQEPQPAQADSSSASSPITPTGDGASAITPDATPTANLPPSTGTTSPPPSSTQPANANHTSPPTTTHTASASATDPGTLATRAVALYNAKNYTGAAALLTQACDRNFAEGCFELGRIYQSNVAGTQDLARAATDFNKACNGGSMAGCNSLGSMYQKGKGEETDLAKALALYEKACDHNFADGCNNLGFMYQQKGAQQDYAKAATYYEKACNGGNAFACNNLGIMYQDAEGRDQDYAKAISLYTKACTGGSSNGCSDLGELYRRGLGVAKDAEKARTYLSKGCDLGNQFGCQHLKLVE